MQRCDNCGVELPGAPRRCPLCRGVPSGEPDGTGGVYPPLSGARAAALRRLLSRIAFGTVCVAAICVCVNLISPAKGWWSLFVLAGCASLWMDFVVVAKKRRNLPKTILWQVAVVSLLAHLWDRYTGYHGWSVDYVLPILCVGAMVAMFVVARLRRLHIQDYILYLVMDSILGLGALGLILTGAVSVITPSAICFCVSVIFLAALGFFKGEALRAEIQRRMHW